MEGCRSNPVGGQCLWSTQREQCKNQMGLHEQGGVTGGWGRRLGKTQREGSRKCRIFRSRVCSLGEMPTLSCWHPTSKREQGRTAGMGVQWFGVPFTSPSFSFYSGCAHRVSPHVISVSHFHNPCSPLPQVTTCHTLLENAVWFGPGAWKQNMAWWEMPPEAVLVDPHSACACLCVNVFVSDLLCQYIYV